MNFSISGLQLRLFIWFDKITAPSFPTILFKALESSWATTLIFISLQRDPAGLFGVLGRSQLVKTLTKSKSEAALNSSYFQL